MTIQKRIKRQKPIEIDCHIKYLCPNNKCNQFHWLSLAESRTKDFIIVCGCGESFKVKQISKIKIQYKKHKSRIINESSVIPEQTVEIEELPTPNPNDFDEKDFIHDCASSLISFGFSQKEAINLLTHSYNQNPTRNHTDLIKQTLLDTFGEKNHDT